MKQSKADSSEKNNAITLSVVKHIATLAQLPLSKEKLEQLAPQLTTVINYMSKIQSLNTENIPETSQVTGLENVLREDVIEPKRTLSQQEVLSSAPKTYKGYVVVKAIFEDE